MQDITQEIIQHLSLNVTAILIKGQKLTSKQRVS